MCQAIRDGGRRCAVHRHASIGMVKAVTELTENLNRHQVERLFSELRREGASSNIPYEVFNVVRENYLATVELDETVREDVEAQLALSREHDEDIDSASMYAFTTLTSRAKERDQKMQDFFNETAERTGLSVEEVKQRFNTEYAGVDTSRGSETPAEYNQNTRRRAVLANLPYDRASVTAIERLKAWNPADEATNTGNLETAEQTVTQSEPELVRRITLTERSGVVGMVGYHNGRLEVQFRNRTGLSRIYAYQNVPAHIAEEMINGDSPIRTYNSSIRGVEEYKYESEEAEEADATAYRCVNCGQFRSLASHECPTSEVREELVNEVGSTEAANAALAENWPEEPTLADNALNEQIAEETETAAEEEALAVEEAVEEAQPETPAETPAPTRRRRAARTPRLRGVTTTLAFPEIETVSVADAVETVSGENFSYDHPLFLQRQEIGEPTNEELIARRVYNRDSMPVEPIHIPEANNIYTEIRQLSGKPFETEAVAFFEAASAEGLTPIAISHYNYEEGSETLLKLFVKEHYAPLDRNFGENPSYLTPVTGKVEYASISRRYLTPEREEGIRLQHAESIETVLAERAAFEEQWGSDAIEDNENIVTVDTNRYRNMPKNRMNHTERKVLDWVRFPTKTEFNTPLRQGKVVVADVATMIAYRSEEYVTEDGRLITAKNARGWGSNVSGKLAFRQRPDGLVEVIGKDLKCRCETYRLTYRCIHTEIALSSFTRIAQGTTPYRPAVEGIDASLTTVTASKLGSIVIGEGDSAPRFRFDAYDGRYSNINLLEDETTPEEAGARRQEILDVASANGGRVSRELREEFIRLSNSTPRAENGWSQVVARKLPSMVKEVIGRSNIEIPLQVEYRTETGHGYNRVNGSIIIGSGSTIDNINIIENSLKCTCPDYRENYDCEHVRDTVSNRLKGMIEAGTATVPHDAIAESLRAYEGHYQFLHNSNSIMSDMSWHNRDYESAETRIVDRERFEREERERIAREAAERARMYDEYRASRQEAWQETGRSLSENMETFQEELSELSRRRERGERIIEMQYENVTDGICAEGDNTRSFGVEIEFDIGSGTDRATALRNIGRELYAAGLTNTDRQNRYHASHGTWNRWSFEQDCTVAGEIVSPIMKDTPEHWQELEKVIEIVKRNGGTASTRAGSHVHISSGSYGQRTAQHAELTRLVRQDEDTIFRLASDPGRGTHRGARWCSPNISLSQSDIGPEQIGRGAGVAGGHGSMLNYDGSINERELGRAHVEFRMWDATLDAAVIQQQVALSAAYVDLAEREVAAADGNYVADNGRERRPLGQAHSRRDPSIRDMTAEQFNETQRPVAEMFDRLFRTDAQREQAMRLYAMTNNQRDN